MHLPWVMGPLNLVNRGILLPNQVAALRALSALSNDGGNPSLRLLGGEEAFLLWVPQSWFW